MWSEVRVYGTWCVVRVPIPKDCDLAPNCALEEGWAASECLRRGAVGDDSSRQVRTCRLCLQEWCDR